MIPKYQVGDVILVKETEFTIKVKNKIHTYKVDINNNKMTISGDKSTKILPIDLPPEALPTTEECNK